MALNPAWRWPAYRDAWLQGTRVADDDLAPALRAPLWPALASASFVEWRYFAVLSPEFHGMIGLAMVNPEQRLPGIAEGGLLLIIAGALGTAGELCWMHLFHLADCRFDQPDPGALEAQDGHAQLRMHQPSATQAELKVRTRQGLVLNLTHQGLDGAVCAPVAATGLDGPLAWLLGSHWQVDCPAPVARCTGELHLTQQSFSGLAEAPGGAADSYANAALRAQVAGETARVFRWQAASGYAEHSFGVRPLPLQGWDFLFVPDADTGAAVVLQTYARSQTLRYLEVFWRQDARLRSHRFSAQELDLTWPDSVFDPVLGVVRPQRRRIRACSGDLTLELDYRLSRRIALLRPHRLAVRHFFISEEIGLTDWCLLDGHGRCLVEVHDQPSGGELAHGRLRTPKQCSPDLRRHAQ